MVAPLSSARVGSGGITYTVSGDTSELKQALASVAKLAKDTKVQPQIDFEQTQIVRSLDAIRRRIQRESVKLQVVAELDQRGLADAARKAGAITQAQLNEVRARAAAGGFGTGPLADLAAAVRAPSRSRMVASGNPLLEAFAGLSIARAGFSTAAQFGMSGAQYESATRLSGSSDALAALNGQMGKVQATQSIPVLGTMNKIADEFLGLTRSLRARVDAEVGMRAHPLAMAEIEGNPLKIQQAASAKRIQEVRSGYAQKGLELDYANPFDSLDQRHYAFADAQKHLDAVKEEERLKMERVKLEAGERQKMVMAEQETSRLRTARTPFAAERYALATRLQSEARLAEFNNPQDRFFLAARNAQLLKEFDTNAARERERNQFSLDTQTGAGEAVAHFRGLHATADTFTRLREMQADIEGTPNEFGQRNAKIVAAIAQARGMSAELGIQGGGHAQRINVGLGQAPDALVHRPILEDRAMARRAIRSFIRGQGVVGDGLASAESLMGGGTTKTMNTTDKLLQDILKAIIKLSDNPHGAALDLRMKAPLPYGGF